MKNRIVLGAYGLITYLRRKKRSALVLAFVVAAPMVFAGATFQGLGFLPGYPNTRAIEVSADGQVIVGSANDASDWGGNSQAFRWTSAGGMEALGFLPGDTSSFVAGVSADGSVIAGTSENPTTRSRQAFIWTQAQGMRGLGFLPMGSSSYSQATDISRDGRVIVGFARDPTDSFYLSFRWTVNGGMVELSFPEISFISAVSADGSVIVGTQFDINSRSFHAFRWTPNEGFLNLGLLPNGLNSTATAVSADGSIVAGYADRFSYANYIGFRWTSTSGIEPLSILENTFEHEVADMSADGKFIVGMAFRGYPETRPMRWTANTMDDLWEVLSRVYGLNLNGWSSGGATGAGATGVSDDGMVIAGWGKNPSGVFEAWRAEIPPEVPAADRVLVQGVMDTSISWFPAVFDPEGDALNCRLTSPPANGLASVNADCSSGTYTAQPGFVGLDSFSYVANDGKQDSNVASVEVAIVEPTPTPSFTGTPTFMPTSTPIHSGTATPTFTPTPTGCLAQYPITQFSQKGKDDTLTITFSGNITAHTDKVVKICPGTTLSYQSTSTKGPVVCKVRNNTTRGSSSLKINDHIKCTDKPAGKDKVGFKVKSGVK